MFEISSIVGSLQEYGALVIILVLAVWFLWKENSKLTDKLIDLNKAYAEAIAELKDLIKGENH